MPNRKKPPATVSIGGREVPLVVAALIAQESDRLGIPPGQVGEVTSPEPAPTHVEIAGYRLTIETGAQLAAQADALGVLPKRAIEGIVTEHVEALERRARRRD
ncbi:MAG TPA: hypothetical protein VK447_01845 [Myxococcaceae bacterium]|nr:hypothetical protein [Myxococcaceae bacterium]